MTLKLCLSWVTVFEAGWHEQSAWPDAQTCNSNLIYDNDPGMAVRCACRSLKVVRVRANKFEKHVKALITVHLKVDLKVELLAVGPDDKLQAKATSKTFEQDTLFAHFTRPMWWPRCEAWPEL